MTSRQRFLEAMNNRMPDRVPVAPDISTYVPLRRAGLGSRDYWSFGEADQIPLWQAYLDAADYFDLDAWIAPVLGLPTVGEAASCEWKHHDKLDTTNDTLVRTSTIETPDGALTAMGVCFRGDQAMMIDKPIKDLAADFRKFRHTKPTPAALDTKTLETFRRACDERNHAFGVTITYPGFHNWNSYIQGGIEALTYAEMDTPDILQEWFEWDLERGDRLMNLALQAGLDYILFGGSGTITLASPDLAMKYAIPALKKWSRMASNAGIPTMIHSCGKNRRLADLLVEHTDIRMLNPLEPLPLGDIDLAEVKRTYGCRLAFMGNLHTTDVMLRAAPTLVRQKSLEAVRDAGLGGGFILSTGDQCGPGTPDENIFEMVRVANEFGAYPLDMNRIESEIQRLVSE